MYEVTTGAALLFAEPDQTGTSLCAIKAGVRFQGVPYTFGTGINAKVWIMIHTDDVPPPLLCFGKEAGQPERGRPHVPKPGIAEMTLKLGNGVIPRELTPRNMRDIQFVDTERQFMCAGCITSVKFFVGCPNIQHDLRFQVYRRMRDNVFRLIDETPAIPCPESGVQKYVLPVPMHISRNDYIGWSHLGSGMIAYDNGGNNMRWSMGRQGKDVNIDMKYGGNFTFSYEVTYKNHCAGHMLYKVSAPAPLYHNPEIKSAERLWVRQDEKCIARIRDLAPASWRGGCDSCDEDEVVPYVKNPQSRSGLLPPISPELSQSQSMSISASMSALDSPMSEWAKKGRGCWISYRQFGPNHSPPNDNCGRWRQLN
jgi:hypothetical protein